MIEAYYIGTFLASVILIIIYAALWDKSFNVWTTIMFIISVMCNWGGVIIARSTTASEALIGTYLTYLSACFLQFCYIMLVFSICKLKAKKPFLIVCMSISLLTYLAMIFYPQLLYTSIELGQKDGVSVLIKQYGPLHTGVYCVTIGYMIVGIAAVIMGLCHQRQVSYQILGILVSVDVVSVGAHLLRFGGKLKVELLPLSNVIDLALLLFLSYRFSLYSVDESVTSSLVDHGKTGFVTFSEKKTFYGANATAVELFPEISDYKVDKPLPDTKICNFADGCLEAAKHMTEPYECNCYLNDRCYKVSTMHRLRKNKSIGYLIMIEDITIEDRQKKELAEYADKMAMLKEEADEANAAKSVFLAKMSHEIRTPINAMLGMDELIMRDSINETIGEYANNIKVYGDVLLGLVNEILDISKIESGTFELVPVKYSTASLVSSCYDMIIARATEKGLRFNVVRKGYIPSALYGDESRIRQIVLNLLTNAVKYTKEGFITLDVEFEKETEDKGKLIFTVKDSGFGIKPEYIDTLFDSFKRVDSKETKGIEGTGLGLALVKQFVETMGGNITVKSTYGAGSIFTACIPQKIEDAVDVEDILAAPQEELSYSDDFSVYGDKYAGKKVLVVDDTMVNLTIAREFLKSIGIDADTVVCGADALAKMREIKYDLIFMDHMMPEMDGIETLKKAQKDPTIDIEGVPLVMMTANATSGAREEYLSNGFTDYISKPFSAKKMCECVAKNLK